MAGERNRYLNLKWETETAFGVENGAHSWKHQVVTADSVDVADLRREVLANDSVRARSMHNVPFAGSKAGRQVGFTAYLTGTGSVPGDGNPPVATTFDPFLKSVIGPSAALFNQDTVTSPGAASFGFTTQVGLSTSGTTVFIAVVTPNNGVQVRPCTIAAGVATLPYALPEAPGAGDIIYPAVNYQWTDDIAETRSFQALIVKDHADGKYLTLGCQGNSLNLSFSARQVPTAEGQFMCINWVDTPSDALEQPAVTPLAKPWMDSHAIIAPFGSSTYDASHLRGVRGDLTLSIARNLTLRSDPNAAQGASMFDTPGDPGIMVDVVLPVSDAWRNDFAAAAPVYYQGIFVVSRVPGQIWAIYVPKMHQIEWPEESEQDGIQTTTVHFGASVGQTGTEFVLAQL